jgi:hypothetical protein
LINLKDSEVNSLAKAFKTCQAACRGVAGGAVLVSRSGDVLRRF